MVPVRLLCFSLYLFLNLMVTQISVGLSVLIASWLAARAARVWGFEDMFFALAMLGFVFFAAISIAFPILGYSVQSPFYLILLVGTVLFGFMSSWMGQE